MYSESDTIPVKFNFEGCISLEEQKKMLITAVL